MAAGRVVFRGSYRGFGRIVAIQDGKHMSSLYAHFEDLRVAVGQLVYRETVLGVVRSSGRSTGPHLHLEVRVGGGSYRPPIDFLSLTLGRSGSEGAPGKTRLLQRRIDT
jgi:murein DD-endopeptidase MepM/ murein hydrolase activator NlpD